MIKTRTPGGNISSALALRRIKRLRYSYFSRMIQYLNSYVPLLFACIICMSLIDGGNPSVIDGVVIAAIVAWLGTEGHHWENYQSSRFPCYGFWICQNKYPITTCASRIPCSVSSRQIPNTEIRWLGFIIKKVINPTKLFRFFGIFTFLSSSVNYLNSTTSQMLCWRFPGNHSTSGRAVQTCWNIAQVWFTLSSSQSSKPCWWLFKAGGTKALSGEDLGAPRGLGLLVLACIVQTPGWPPICILWWVQNDTTWNYSGWWWWKYTGKHLKTEFSAQQINGLPGM